MRFYLDELDLTPIRQGYGRPTSRATVNGNSIQICGQNFERGIGIHATCEIRLRSTGWQLLSAYAGIVDDVGQNGSGIFEVLDDTGNLLWRSPVMRGGDRPVRCQVTISGISEIYLNLKVADEGIEKCHAAWADLCVEGEGDPATPVILPVELEAPNYTATELGESVIYPEDRIAVPPKGWNSWNCFGLDVTQEMMEEAARRLDSSGLSQFGYTYVNLDDGWSEGGVGSGPVRANSKFPDIRGMTDFIHSLGLRAGTYSSPGRETCGGYPGSYGRESLDAKFFAATGFDFLKYDYCSYSKEIPWDSPIEDHAKPYRRMRESLNETGRDFVFSICTGGAFKPWLWGAEAGAQMWRTTTDVFDSWGSMIGNNRLHDSIASLQSPGKWNDPDMMVVGSVGWGATNRQRGLAPIEEQTHVTLYAILSAPMLLGCDLTNLDECLLSLLTNSEVLAIHEAGISGYIAAQVFDTEVWLKPLPEGEAALATINISPLPSTIHLQWPDLKLPSRMTVRDCWTKTTLGTADSGIPIRTPAHGSRLFRLKSVAAQPVNDCL